jgi:hypothetical protein
MKNKNLLYIAIGIVILAIVYKYFKSRAWYLDFNSEPTANASGSRLCYCEETQTTKSCIGLTCNECCSDKKKRKGL